MHVQREGRGGSVCVHLHQRTLASPLPCSLLKKHHKHEQLPVRAWLGELGTLKQGLLPLAASSPLDMDLHYILAKVLVFMTEWPGPGTAGPIEAHLAHMRGE